MEAFHHSNIFHSSGLCQYSFAFFRLYNKIIQDLSLLNIAYFFQHNKFDIHQCCSIFLFIAEQYSILWMYCCLFVHLLVDEYLYYLQLYMIMNKDATNNCSRCSTQPTEHGVISLLLSRLLIDVQWYHISVLFAYS